MPVALSRTHRHRTRIYILWHWAEWPVAAPHSVASEGRKGSVQFSSVQDDIYALEKLSHAVPAPVSRQRFSQRCRLWLETVPMFAWLTTALSRPCKEDRHLAVSRVVLWLIVLQVCDLKFITILWWRHSCSIFITTTTVKVRLFRWWCCVCCIVLLTLCIIILRARGHDHNKIAPCGMIKSFWTELNWIVSLPLWCGHCVVS